MGLGGDDVFIKECIEFMRDAKMLSNHMVTPKKKNLFGAPVGKVITPQSNAQSWL